MGVWGISDESIAYIRSLSDKLDKTADELKASAAALLTFFDQNEKGMGRHSAELRRLIEELCALSDSEKYVRNLSKKLRMSAAIRESHVNSATTTSKSDKFQFNYAARMSVGPEYRPANLDSPIPMRFGKRLGAYHGTAHSALSTADIGASASQADVGDGAAVDSFYTPRAVILPLSLESLPEQVQSSCQSYRAIGWSGNYPGQASGTSAGKVFENDEDILPVTLPSGELIEYREFDVNNKIPGKGRDALRFLKGSDGSVYYTDDHYLTFYKIDTGGQR